MRCVIGWNDKNQGWVRCAVMYIKREYSKPFMIIFQFLIFPAQTTSLNLYGLHLIITFPVPAKNVYLKFIYENFIFESCLYHEALTFWFWSIFEGWKNKVGGIFFVQYLRGVMIWKQIVDWICDSLKVMSAHRTHLIYTVVKNIRELCFLP